MPNTTVLSRESRWSTVDSMYTENDVGLKPLSQKFWVRSSDFCIWKFQIETDTQRV